MTPSRLFFCLLAPTFLLTIAQVGECSRGQVPLPAHRHQQPADQPEGRVGGQDQGRHLRLGTSPRERMGWN